MVLEYITITCKVAFLLQGSVPFSLAAKTDAEVYRIVVAEK